jgi:hypothetical protein
VQARRLRSRGGNFDAEALKARTDADDEAGECERQQRQALQRPQPAARRGSRACGVLRCRG